MNSRRILAVGLSDQGLRLLQEHTEKDGYQVIAAMDLYDAGWIISHRSFQLIVLDLAEINQNGLGIFADALSRAPSTPVVAFNAASRHTWFSTAKGVVCLPRGKTREAVISAVSSMLNRQ